MDDNGVNCKCGSLLETQVAKILKIPMGNPNNKDVGMWHYKKSGIMP